MDGSPAVFCVPGVPVRCGSARAVIAGTSTAQARVRAGHRYQRSLRRRHCHAEPQVSLPFTPRLRARARYATLLSNCRGPARLRCGKNAGWHSSGARRLLLGLERPRTQYPMRKRTNVHMVTCGATCRRMNGDQNLAEFVPKLIGLGKQILGLGEQIFAFAADYIE